MKRRKMSFQSEASREAEGARPVGQMDEISPRQQWLVKCVRCWMDVPDYPSLIKGMLPGDSGTHQKMLCLRACEAFLCNLAVSVQRPIARHAVECPCIGQDEAVLLSVMHHAGIGDRYGAKVHAARLVRSDRLEPLIDAAEDLSIVISGDVYSAESFERPSLSPRTGHLH